MEYSFEKLKIWEESRNLVRSVYSLEVYCQLIISKDLGYITDKELSDIKPQIDYVSYLLTKLKKSLETNYNTN